ncbi:MAG: FMN-binding protein [Faecalibacterium prausnitzii]
MWWWEVTADATTIYSITVKEQNETQGIGSVGHASSCRIPWWPQNSYNVDGIAGATVTSDALNGSRESRSDQCRAGCICFCSCTDERCRTWKNCRESVL